MKNVVVGYAATVQKHYFILSLLSTDFNECASDPCDNGAACNDGVNMYTCSCVAGYEGINCATGKRLYYILFFNT